MITLDIYLTDRSSMNDTGGISVKMVFPLAFCAENLAKDFILSLLQADPTRRPQAQVR